MGNWKVGFLLALLTAVMWGALPIVLKVLLECMDAYTITWYRFLAATFFLGLFLLRRRHLPSLGKLGRESWLILTIAVGGLLGNYVLYLVGLSFVTPETSQMVIQLAPIFLLLGGLALFGESFSKLQWIGLALLSVGFLLFFNNRVDDLISGSGRYYLGVLLTVVAAVLWAAYALAQKRLLRRLDSEQILVLLYAASVVILFPAAGTGQVLRLNGIQGFLLLFASVNTVIAYGAFAEALAHWEASRVSAVLSVTPLLTFLSVWLVSQKLPDLVQPEPMNALSWAGTVMVVTGSMIAALGRRRRRSFAALPLE